MTLKKYTPSLSQHPLMSLRESLRATLAALVPAHPSTLIPELDWRSKKVRKVAAYRPFREPKTKSLEVFADAGATRGSDGRRRRTGYS